MHQLGDELATEDGPGRGEAGPVGEFAGDPHPFGVLDTMGGLMINPPVDIGGLGRLRVWCGLLVADLYGGGGDVGEPGLVG